MQATPAAPSSSQVKKAGKVRRSTGQQGDPAQRVRECGTRRPQRLLGLEAGGGCLSNRIPPAVRVWPFDLYMQRPRGGYQVGMKREREIDRERDELDSLAAEAGASAVLVGTTALILVVALILGLAV
jgi:hypothetical protein